MTQEEYWYWLCNIKNVYQGDISRLLHYFSGPEEIFQANEDMLLKSEAADHSLARKIVLSKGQVRQLYRLEKLKREGIQFVYYGCPEYPRSLLELEDKPWALYVKGKLPDPELPSVGIVGSRSCSGYGREMALKYAQSLAANQVQIISGMALGIDAAASSGALDVGGKTFVVLGGGVDVVYPQQNLELYYRIILNGGGVISEYPMRSAPLAWQFPHRNRLISGLSEKLLVIEARKHSGTLSTVSHALRQGKDVYALPGRVTDPLSEGCNQMIADGAGVLLDPKDFVELNYASYRSERSESHLQKIGKKTEAVPESMSQKKESEQSEYARVLQVLSYEPKRSEELAYLAGLSISETTRVLFELELLDLCTQEAANYYRKC